MLLTTVARAFGRGAFVVLALCWAASAPPAHATDVSKADRAAMEKVIRQYLSEHPEVVIDAIRAYQTRQQAQQQEQTRANLVKFRDALEKDAMSPVIGNPDGDVTIVEFFDYRCGYCKSVLPAIRGLIAADKGVRYVLKEFPVLGPDSVTAAKASLAVWKDAPDRYLDFHSALLSTRGNLNEDRIMRVVDHLGLDSKKIRKTMDEPWVEEQIQANYALGGDLGIRGTPAFVIGDEVRPGAVGIDELRAMIKEARSS